MKPLTLQQIVAAVEGRWVGQPPRGARQLVATGVSTDTRKGGAGELYIPIVGERFDGHAFLTGAAEKGCVAALVNESFAAGADAEVGQAFAGGLIAVADTRTALGKLSAWHRAQCEATVIAVTGSNGKTTTKRMIHHILRTHLRGSASPASFNNDIGVPLTLLGVADGDDYVVCEIGTNAPGEIAALSAMARPDLAVITSVGQTHLEKLGSLSGVTAEKASILDHLAPGGVGVVWADSEGLAQALSGRDVPLVRFGTARGADLRITGYEPTAGGQRFEINGQLWATMPLPGRHMAANALAAIAVAGRMGIDLADAAAALADFAGVEMRLERIDCGAITILNDAYNANPASLLAAADVLADTPDAARRILVAGDMRELGRDAQAIHRRTGEQLAAMNLDCVIGVGELGRYISGGAADAGARALSADSIDQAADVLAELLQAGDVVLLKGSRTAGIERLIEPIRQAAACFAATRTESDQT
jgi:UDP-N-acetylmuramoyl-tripeptide--D-alanyl-D-alanine ligase